MSLTEASGTDMQVKSNINDKTQDKNGDEQIEGMSLTVTASPELTDPAVIAVRIRYEKDFLLMLRDAPMSQRKPDFLDVNTVSSSIWDPERWNYDRKKSDTPTENGPNTDHRRRTGDPRERIRKENDGIVLSPQRRSFNSGCFVPVRENSRTNRPHSPLGKTEVAVVKCAPPHTGVREIPQGNRRIGSGRILRDAAWDFNEKSEDRDCEYGSSGGSSGGYRPQRNNERDDKFERRSFGREFEMGKEKDSRRNSRYERRRIESKDEEPEWFSGGPSSQNDTIELRGFDESEKLPCSKKKVSPSRNKKNSAGTAKEWPKKKGDTAGPNQQNSTVSDEKDENKDEPKSRSSPKPQAGESGDAKVDGRNDKVGTEGNDIKNGVGGDQSFNFDDILKCDTIPGLLTNGVGGDGDKTATSRFSRWFKRESPENHTKTDHHKNSRSSSIHEDLPIIKDLLDEPPSLTIPGNSDSYFAPISPAANTGGGVLGRNIFGSNIGSGKPINLMEMLQRGQGQQNVGGHGDNHMKQPMPNKILSLDELEAKMRQAVDLNAANVSQKLPQKPEDMAEFKRLLAQASSGHNITKNGPMKQQSQPMSLLEMLSHSQQQDEARLANVNLLSPSTSNLTHRVPQNAMTLKLQQAQQQKQQMEMLNKLMNTGVPPHHQMRSSPLNDLGMQQSRELLNRPEAQAILQGLKRGDITAQHLYQQLGNPALQPRHRDMLVAILKLQSGTGGIGPSPRVLSPVPPAAAAAAGHPLFQQQQQQLRISPLPPNAMHQRIPSPRELQVHTQNILQRALIKKKLEEQQENYRKKQEMQQQQQRGHSPSTSIASTIGGATKSLSSPTQLAFTPTSVLRKMTADKEDAKENKIASETGKLPQGRAVTGMRPQPQPQPQTTQPQWNPQYSVKQPPVGRPIVKANPNFQQGQMQTAEQFFAQHQRIYGQQQQPQIAPVSSQQQQRKSSNPNHYQQPNAANNGGIPQGVHMNQQHHHTHYMPNQQFSSNQQLTQQQLRAQHQQQARPTAQGAAQQQPQAPGSSLHLQGQPAQHQMPSAGYQGNQQQVGAWQQFLNAAQPGNTRNTMGRSNVTDGDLSPTTTNQLARWFSPDLLERARGGELPSTAGLAQHVLSLEEIERQAAPAVHN